MTEASGSGTLQVVLALTERLAAAGHTVALAYGRRPETPATIDTLLAPGVTGYELPWTRRTPRHQLRAAWSLRRLVGELEPDVVHLHSSFAGLVGTLAVPRGTTCVYTPHGFAFSRGGRLRRLAYRAGQRLIARRCLVGAVSEPEAALARGILSARRVVVVHNGIPELDPGALPAGRPDPRAPRVVGLGRVAAERRPEEAAAILSAVADVAEVEWIGAAAGGEDAPLRAAGVPVTGWLTREAALERLGTATAYLHWSASDGLSLAVLEALAHDVVIVASDIDANREVVGAEQVRGDPAAAAALLRDVVCDPDLHARLVREQRARRARYSAARMAADWTAVYDRLNAPTQGSAQVPLHPKIGTPWS